MHLDDREAALLKRWTIKKLEDISDADSEVLADYVLALIRNDDPDAVNKINCVENLRDFLPDNVESFVNDVFTAIATKAYDPSRPSLKPAIASYVPPRRGAFESARRSNESRKRSYHDWDKDGGEAEHTMAFDGSDRPMKQARRGAKAGHDQRAGRPARAAGRLNEASPNSSTDYMAQLLNMPMPPPGMLPFDPKDPLAAMLAMQRAMGLLPPFASADHQGFPNSANRHRPAQRCRDYDQKGFCARGAQCPYEHGEDPYIIPAGNGEYDPQNATLLDRAPDESHKYQAIANGRAGTKGRGRGSTGFRGGKQRAPFSHIGRGDNMAAKSIVVEQIPEDSFDEQAVRGFFGDFGTITEVTMQPYKRLAIVHFDDHDAAQAAYDSPKAVFDNRFVKVLWYKPDRGLPNGQSADSRRDPPAGDIESGGADDSFDADAFSRQQEEAQRKHEEAKRQREDLEQRRKQLDDELRQTETERRRLASLLAKKTGMPVVEEAEESEHTKALKLQLAKLEAEAKSLGIDPEDAVQSYSGPPAPIRGRGGYRGRGRGRGRYTSHRGGWAGAEGRAGAVMRLDNRPKTVCVSFNSGRYDDYNEALRQYLMLTSMDTAVLSKHPDRDDAALLRFAQRYEAEKFISAGSDLPHIGKVELSWYVPSEKHHPTAHDDNSSDIDIKVGDAPTVTARQDEVRLRDMDTYDELDDVE